VNTFVEKIVLLALAGLCIVSLTWIAVKALSTGTVDPNAATLIGVIAAGLVAFGKDIVAAIRSYAMSAQLSKVTDQLAKSVPPSEGPTGTPEDPVNVKEPEQ
jgi:microsomal dipeptidase-like Zn-dependent dipeptidase